MTVRLETRIGPGFLTTPTFEHMPFPAGEAHLMVINENGGKGALTEIARVYGASGDDMFTLAMWADAARRRGARTILLMPYLPGARADHDDFVPFGVGVYADFINSLMVDQVICFDPHSPVMPRLLRNVTVIDSTRLIRRRIVGRADRDAPQQYDGIIAPDEGAVERAQKVAEATHLPLYRAQKHRDQKTGKLSDFTCEPLPEWGRFLVVDDICDGGGTFKGLAAATGLPRERLGLYVSHGVFSGGAMDLDNYYGEIWTTDSFRELEMHALPPFTLHPSFRVAPLRQTMNGHIEWQH